MTQLTFKEVGNLRQLVQLDTYEKQKQVRTAPENFENAASFLLLGLPSTLIRHENGVFRKRSSNRRNLKIHRFLREKHFKNGAFQI